MRPNGRFLINAKGWRAIVNTEVLIDKSTDEWPAAASITALETTQSCPSVDRAPRVNYDLPIDCHHYWRDSQTRGQGGDRIDANFLGQAPRLLVLLQQLSEALFDILRGTHR